MAILAAPPLACRAASPVGTLRLRRTLVAQVAPLLGRTGSASPFARVVPSRGQRSTVRRVSPPQHVPVIPAGLKHFTPEPSIGMLKISACIQAAMSVNDSRDSDREAVAAAPQLSASDIWPAICQRYTTARQSGAAAKTDTAVEVFREATPAGPSVDWVLRLASALKKKPKGDFPPPKSEAGGADKPLKAFFNPFDPPEPALTVGHLSSTHSLVLNKFNVVAHHSIVITRTFQPQTDPLNAEDLMAIYQVLGNMPDVGLAFFNCGQHSGRSQPHKHVQIVPLPFSDGQPAEIPLAAPLLAAADGCAVGEVAEARNLPFRAYVCRLSGQSSVEELATSFNSLYSKAFGSAHPEEEVSYNWIGCMGFMAIFPRSQEKAELLAVNALGFAGTLLCRSEGEVAFAKEFGCLNILQRVGLPW